MKRHLSIALLILFSTCAMGQDAGRQRQIQEALMPLPVPLRDKAAVVLDATPRQRIILRQGENGIICRANTSKAMFDVYCYAQGLDPFYRRFAELAHEGKSNMEIRDAVNSEVASGKLSKPAPGATVYEMSGDSSDSSLPLMAIFLPYATAESTGLSTQRDHYRPWLMWAGTAFAHVMIPGK